jgi:hypothetical protein
LPPLFRRSGDRFDLFGALLGSAIANSEDDNCDDCGCGGPGYVGGRRGVIVLRRRRR